MEEKHVNLRKMRRMAVLAFKNALRLHSDSILLYRQRCAPSAYYISSLAMEELGKYNILEDFIWHSEIEGRYEPEWEQKWMQLVYQHRAKQNQFAFHIQLEPFARRAVQDIYTGKKEQTKQDSVYVGLPRQKGKVDLHGRIRSPFKITLQMAKAQVTLVNDSLLLLTAGVIKGVYIVDVKEIEEYLTHDLIRLLETDWPEVNPSARRRLNKFMGLPDQEQ